MEESIIKEKENSKPIEEELPKKIIIREESLDIGDEGSTLL